MNKKLGNNVEENISATSKTFTEDTAEKTGVTARRQEIYELLHPETKKGAFNKSNNFGKSLVTENISDSKTFTADTAEKQV